MMNTAVVLMTALVPTTGHADLISFAATLDVDKVDVLLCGRSFEPLDAHVRAQALREHFAGQPKVDVRVLMDDDAPQNPPDHPDFWGWWARAIRSHFPESNFRYVVASEPYGQQVADSITAQFMPYDIDRALNPARGTDVRENLWGHWNQIIPEARQHLMLNVTVFGQESVGKTTVSRAVTQMMKTDFIPEWARPYLEAVGEELTEQKMRNIVVGQAGLQRMVRSQAKHPVAVYDTDLFSTVGYYQIGEMTPPAVLEAEAVRMASDVYYLMPDSIPFCPDPLRYGGDQRESDMKFWVKILEDYSLNYVVVPDGSAQEKAAFIYADVVRRFHEKNKALREFLRD